MNYRFTLMSIFLSNSLSLYPYVLLSLYLTVSISYCPYILLSLYLTVSLSNCFTVYRTVFIYFCFSVFLGSVSLSLCHLYLSISYIISLSLWSRKNRLQTGLRSRFARILKTLNKIEAQAE